MTPKTFRILVIYLAALFSSRSRADDVAEMYLLQLETRSQRTVIVDGVSKLSSRAEWTCGRA